MNKTLEAGPYTGTHGGWDVAIQERRSLYWIFIISAVSIFCLAVADVLWWESRLKWLVLGSLIALVVFTLIFLVGRHKAFPGRIIRDQTVEKPVTRVEYVDKPVETVRVVEKVVEKPVEKIRVVEKIVEKPVEVIKYIDRPPVHIKFDAGEEKQHVIIIEGIGEKFASRLNANGIITIPQLIKAPLKDIAKFADVTEELGRQWQAMGALMQLSGIGPQFAELLVRAGITSPKDLAAQNAEDLVARIHTLEAGRKTAIQKADVGVGRAKRWIEAAKAGA